MRILTVCILSALVLISCSKNEPKNPNAGQMPPGMTGGQMPPQGMGDGSMPPGMGGGAPMGGDNPAPTVKVAGAKLEFENVSMTTPENWINEKPTSSMRVVQYFLKNDEETTIVGSYFGNKGMMVDENIQRWEQQFSKVDKKDKQDMSGGKVVMVTMTGTFKKKASMMSEDFSEVPNYMMLAAIVQTNNGPYFFKMVGTKTLLTNEINNFKKFLGSYSEKK